MESPKRGFVSASPRLPLGGKLSAGQGAKQFEHIMVFKNIKLAIPINQSNNLFCFIAWLPM